MYALLPLKFVLTDPTLTSVPFLTSFCCSLIAAACHTLIVTYSKVSSGSNCNFSESACFPVSFLSDYDHISFNCAFNTPGSHISAETCKSCMNESTGSSGCCLLFKNLALS